MMEAESYQNNKSRRLSEIAKEFNVSVLTLTNFLRTKGYTVENNPMAMLRDECYILISNEYQSEKALKEEAKRVKMLTRAKNENIRLDNIRKKELKENKLTPSKDEFKYIQKNSELEVKPILHLNESPDNPIKLKVIGKIDLDKLNTKTKPARKAKIIAEEKLDEIGTQKEKEIKSSEIIINTPIESYFSVEIPERINDNKAINLEKQNNTQRLSKVAKEFDVKIATIIKFLKTKGHSIENNPMAKLPNDLYPLISNEYQAEKAAKEEAKRVKMSSRIKKESLTIKIEEKTTAKVDADKKENLELKIKRARIKREIKQDTTPVVEIIQSVKIIPPNQNKKEEPSFYNKFKDNSINLVGHKYFINFHKDRVVLIKGKAMSLVELNLPRFIEKIKKPMSWMIKVIKYKNQIISVNIISYHYGHNEYTDDQMEDELFLKAIKSIKFNNLNRDILLQLYEGKKPKDVLYPPEKKFTSFNNENLTSESLKETIYVSFNDLEFKTGKVVFKKKLWLTGKFEELEIFNYFILKEFNPLKKYFQKALGVDKIKVEIKVKEKHSFLSVRSLIAYSPEIDRINDKLISLIGLNIMKKKAKNKDAIKSLLTIDKLLESYDSNEHKKISSSVFYSTESQFLDTVLDVEKPKHHNHLKYLSSKQSLSHKLKFFFKPFSFIFLLEESNKNYIVWETLDTSEATYIWVIKKDPSKLFEEIERIESVIVSLIVTGKISYIKTKDKSRERIYHDYSEINDGFPKWRYDLESWIKTSNTDREFEIQKI